MFPFWNSRIVFSVVCIIITVDGNVTMQFATVADDGGNVSFSTSSRNPRGTASLFPVCIIQKV